MDDSSRNFRNTDIWRRPQTEELVDVHVYVVPSNGWIEQRKLAKRDIIDQAVSSGFVRVIPSTTLLELRGDIKEQLGFENVPEAFVFLRSVGRNFTQVKSKQELDLKVKSFVPPCADEPEIYVKEGEYTIVRSASLGVLSQSSALNNSDSPTACSTSSDSPGESRNESLLTSSSSEQPRRALSLDRRAAPMSSSFAQRRPPQKIRSSRPPTPRVQERLFVKPASKFRSSSKTSMKLNDSIRESPREQVDEEVRVVSRTLLVETDTERINSPPPRPQSQSNKANNVSDIKIPVPTPTPTPIDLVQQLQTTSEEARAERRLKELKRDALMQKVRDLQRRKASSKDRAREEWRKRYQDVKKCTPRLEDHCSKLRQELEKLVKDMLVSVKVDPESKPHKPSKKTSYKIMIMRHLQEVEDLKGRLQSVTIRLNAESKLRAQAEFEVKRLRQDLLHKKTQVTLTRKQTAFPQTSEQFFISAV